MSRLLTLTDETKLAKAITSVVEKQTAGETPTDALFKTAMELSLQPGEIRTVAHSVNTGMQLDQMENGKDASSRFAPFALCDPESVIDRLLDSHKTSFDRPEKNDNSLAKIAACRPSVSGPATGRTKVAFAAAPAAPTSTLTPVGSVKKRAAIQAKTAYLNSRMQLGREIKKLAQLLTIHGQSDYILALKQAAIAKHGDEAVTVLFRSACKEAGWAEDHLEKAFRNPASNVKLATSDHPLLKQVEECVGACVKAADFLAEFNRQTQVCSPVAKKAGFRPSLKTGGAMDVALGNILASSFYGPNANRMGTAGQFVNKKQEELDDPLQDQKLRNIRTQSMLSQLLTNEQDPLGGTHPLLASEAYNELTALAPRASQQAAIVAPWLRRRLEGKIEPFEAKAVADTEKVLKSNTAIGSNIPGNQDI